MLPILQFVVFLVASSPGPNSLLDALPCLSLLGWVGAKSVARCIETGRWWNPVEPQRPGPDWIIVGPLGGGWSCHRFASGLRKPLREPAQRVVDYGGGVDLTASLHRS